MRISPTTDEQVLRLLNSSDSSGTWSSCDEKRHCIICDLDFKGRDVRMSWFGNSLVKLRCPTAGCRGGAATWVRLGNPLVAGEASEDWDRILEEAEAAAW